MADEDLSFDISENDAAVAYLQAKAVTNPTAFGRLPASLKIRAFTAAGLDNLETLSRIRDAVASVPAGGDWKTARRAIADEIGGDLEGAKARAELILRVNAFQAYAVGRFAEQVGSLAAFPYWMYRSSRDERVRSSHAALDGVILPADDPWWRTHYPPWEFGCRCMVVRLTRGQAEALGVADPKKIPGKPADGYSFDPSTLTVDIPKYISGLSGSARRDAEAVFASQKVRPDPEGPEVSLLAANATPGGAA